jgi:hypothetical protein
VTGAGSSAKIRFAKRDPPARPSLTSDERRAFIFARQVLALANAIVDAAVEEVTFDGNRDPKVIGLALLCRSISNFQGALAMARNN